MSNLSDTSQISHVDGSIHPQLAPPMSITNSYYLALLVCCNTHLWALIATDANAADPNFLESQVAQLSTRQSEQARQSLGCAFLFQLCYDIINSSWNNKHDVSVTETLWLHDTLQNLHSSLNKLGVHGSLSSNSKMSRQSTVPSNRTWPLASLSFQSATHPTN